MRDVPGLTEARSTDDAESGLLRFGGALEGRQALENGFCAVLADVRVLQRRTLPGEFGDSADATDDDVHRVPVQF